MANLVILVLISLLCTVIGYHLIEKGKKLKTNGRKAKGVIIKNNYKILSNKSSGIYYPVVRFLTETNESIKQELSLGTNTPKAEGTKIDLLYNPLNPNEVLINSQFALKYIPWSIFLMGFLGFILSISEFLGITTVTK